MTEEQEANAALIALAPDLARRVIALEEREEIAMEALRHISVYKDCKEKNMDGVDAKLFVDIALEAIEKMNSKKLLED